MMLKNKNAVIYGAGGSLGGAVACALAGAGAKVFLTGRNLGSVQKIAEKILAAGGQVVVDQVDALNKTDIDNHLAKVVQQAGSVDISFNAIGYNVVQNINLVDISLDDFVFPINTAMQTQFLTCTAAAKAMIRQRSGVILTLTATPGGVGYPLTAGFGPTCSAVESFSRTLASEVGVHGVRVVNIRSGGSPDSWVFKNALSLDPEGMASVLKKMEQDTMLKRLPLMADIANTAVFLSSPMAASITGVTIDVTAGTTVALNYRVEQDDTAPLLLKNNL